MTSPTTLPAMPASAAFAAWYESQEHRSLEEVVSLASGPDASAWHKAHAAIAAMLQAAFEAGQTTAAEPDGEAWSQEREDALMAATPPRSQAQLRRHHPAEWAAFDERQRQQEGRTATSQVEPESTDEEA
jgi:hypothetical protein